MDAIESVVSAAAVLESDLYPSCVSFSARAPGASAVSANRRAPVS